MTTRMTTTMTTMKTTTTTTMTMTNDEVFSLSSQSFEDVFRFVYWFVHFPSSCNRIHNGEEEDEDNKVGEDDEDDDEDEDKEDDKDDEGKEDEVDDKDDNTVNTYPGSFLRQYFWGLWPNFHWVEKEATKKLLRVHSCTSPLCFWVDE